MKTRLILKPGQRGTKALVEKYGDALVCVRFRYDAEQCKRLKTIDLIVEEIDWIPPLKPERSVNNIVPLRIEGYELNLRAKVKTAGGIWDSKKKLWFVKFGNIVGTQLEKHIYVDTT